MANPKGNPQNLTPWKPGESGNPNGRPKKGQAVTDILRETVDKQSLVEKLLELAQEGDLAALKYCIDRLDGKPVETVNQTVRNVPEYVGFADTDDTENQEAD